jgi:hypothetical protein
VLSDHVSGDQISYALRAMRANCYALTDTGSAVTVSLSMRASDSGRRNAAERIATLLARAGLQLDGADPVADLVTAGTAVPVHVRPPDPQSLESGGDAACWANRVCPECGRLNDAEHPQVCQVCGARFV